MIGTLPEVAAGGWAEAAGRWAVDREYGRQFRAATLRTAPPTAADGMRMYLPSGLATGIGPADGRATWSMRSAPGCST